MIKMTLDYHEIRGLGRGERSDKSATEIEKLNAKFALHESQRPQNTRSVNERTASGNSLMMDSVRFDNGVPSSVAYPNEANNRYIFLGLGY